GTRLGDSISIDGVCQTVTEINSPEKGTFAVDTLGESLKKTTLGSLRSGTAVNLERALRPDSRMGGHFVQGHIACTVRIRDFRTTGNNVYLAVEIPEPQLRYCVPEGSIALDGISLTIADISGNVLTLNIIPATLKATSLGHKKTGDRMNLETDIIGRYVERLMTPGLSASGLSFERLRELGY
ncbi:riboflavin synthase, partial [Breznakiellaceae bacterium SP9]